MLPNLPPADFTNPHERRIFDLENEYIKGIETGKTFAEVKMIREAIKKLRAELSAMQAKQ